MPSSSAKAQGQGIGMAGDNTPPTPSREAGRLAQGALEEAREDHWLRVVTRALPSPAGWGWPMAAVTASGKSLLLQKEAQQEKKKKRPSRTQTAKRHKKHPRLSIGSVGFSLPICRRQGELGPCDSPFSSDPDLLLHSPTSRGI